MAPFEANCSTSNEIETEELSDDLNPEPEVPMFTPSTLDSQMAVPGHATIKTRKHRKQQTSKGNCIGQLTHLSPENLGVNWKCKQRIDSTPHFNGRGTRANAVPTYVILKHNLEYILTLEIEYLNKVILMWQAFNMDDPRIKVEGLHVSKYSKF